MDDILYHNQYSEKVRKTPYFYQATILDLLKPVAGEKILEIGFNRGEILKSIGSQTGASIYGVDVNEQVVNALKLANTFVAGAQELPFADGFFEKVYSIHVLEHVQDLQKSFKEIARVTKPGGLALHAFPAYLPFVPRGIDGALLDSLKMTKNPFEAIKLARKLHMHKLDPTKLLEFVQLQQWELKYSRRFFVLAEFGFSWIVVLERK